MGWRLPRSAFVALLSAAVVGSACGGGHSTSPTSPAPDPCVPQTVQCLLDAASVAITLNNVSVTVGSTVAATVGSTANVKVDYVNTSGQTAWTCLLYVRDDGRERVGSCGGAGAGGALSFGGFGGGLTISPNDLVFTPGHTAKVSVVGSFRPFSPPGTPSPLLTVAGALDHAAVQGERYVATLAVQ